MMRPHLVMLLTIALVWGGLANAKTGTRERSREDGLAYGCEGLLPSSERAPAPSDPLLGELEEVAKAPERDTLWLSHAQTALVRVATADMMRMPLPQRVVLQNQVFHLALLLADEARPDRMSSAIDYREAQVAASFAADLVLRMAPSPQEMAEMGAEPDPVLDRWLGGPDFWTERSTSFCGKGDLLLHERRHEGTLAFRPVRAGFMRGLVAQVIAFDSNGEAYVTPVVERVEMRRGLEVDSPACVAALDPAAMGDGPGPALRLREHRDIVRDMFVFPVGNGVGCTNCHSSLKAFNVQDVTDPEEAAELVAARRGRVIDFAEQQLREITKR